jgi:hypothetical protein
MMTSLLLNIADSIDQSPSNRRLVAIKKNLLNIFPKD